MDEVVTEGSSIIVMSHDEKSTITTTHHFEVDDSAISTSRSVPSTEENFLILGWNKIGELILRELDQYVMKGTVVTIVSGTELTTDLNVLQKGFNNLNVSALVADHTDRESLNDVARSDRTSIVILADKQVNMQEADAKTLMTLIHLRDITSKFNHKINIVTEMLDDRNRELAGLSGASDFIVSNKIIALMLTQISENRDLYDVYSEFFDAKGNELYLKQIVDYVVPARPLTFATLIKSAAAKGQVAIGYKKNIGVESEVFLNVNKDKTLVFNDTDQVIVISES
jgi:voltage-gated potassium channel Kch